MRAFDTPSEMLQRDNDSSARWWYDRFYLGLLAVVGVLAFRRGRWQHKAV